MDGIFSKKFEITMSDISEVNELSNKGILRFLQEIACLHSDSCGSSVSNQDEIGIAWILLNWKVRVFSRPHWNTPVMVKTWSSGQKHLSFYRDFEITDENNNLVAIATSKWLPLDIFNKTFAKITPELLDRYHIIDKKGFDEPMKEKFLEPENSVFVKDYTVLRRDLDTNHHMNNLNYLDLAYEAIPDNISSDFSDIEIMYKSEAKLGDVLELYCYSSDNNEYTITIKDKNTNALHCIIKLK